MVSVHDVDATELINKAAEKLEIQMPEWAKFVKTGAHRERPPVQKNWWQIRAAAVLRTIYKDGPVGVSKLRSKYGGSKNRGVAPNAFRKGSGKILRVVMQQLESLNLVKKAEKGKGRIITPAGQSFLEKVATEIYQKRGAPPKVKAPKVKKVRRDSPKKEQAPKQKKEKEEAKVEKPKKGKKEG